MQTSKTCPDRLQTRVGGSEEFRKQGSAQHSPRLVPHLRLAHARVLHRRLANQQHVPAAAFAQQLQRRGIRREVRTDAKVTEATGAAHGPSAEGAPSTGNCCGRANSNN